MRRGPRPCHRAMMQPTTCASKASGRALTAASTSTRPRWSSRYRRAHDEHRHDGQLRREERLTDRCVAPCFLAPTCSATILGARELTTRQDGASREGGRGTRRGGMIGGHAAPHASRANPRERVGAVTGVVAGHRHRTGSRILGERRFSPSPTRHPTRRVISLALQADSARWRPAGSRETACRRSFEPGHGPC